MHRLPLRQLLTALLPLGVATAPLAPASAATFTVTQADWGPSSAFGSFAWANGANQLINPIDGLVITKDVYGNPRTTSGTRDIGAVQTPGPLPIAGFGVAFGWSRRLRRRISSAR